MFKTITVAVDVLRSFVESEGQGQSFEENLLNLFEADQVKVTDSGTDNPLVYLTWYNESTRSVNKKLSELGYDPASATVPKDFTAQLVF